MTGKVNLVQQQLNKAMTSPKLQVEYMELGDEIGKGDKKTILLEIVSLSKKLFKLQGSLQ